MVAPLGVLEQVLDEREIRGRADTCEALLDLQLVRSRHSQNLTIIQGEWPVAIASTNIGS